jgi:hypothetical protein
MFWSYDMWVMSQLAWRSVARGGRQWPLAVRRRRHRCHRTVEGGMARATHRDWQAGPSESGARFLWRGVGGREESEAAWRRGADLRARPAQCRAARFKLGLKSVQSYSNGSIKFWIPQNFGWFKRYFPVFQKFERNLVRKSLRWGTTLLIETCSDSEWILN